jgi:hypothetical protein
MNSKLPKPMLDALAHETPPADHPSADVLSAFVEQALGEREKQSVTDHLARCGECREIVFLTSEASEPAARDQQIVAAKPRWHRTSRWVWAAPVAAIFLLGAGYLMRQRHFAAPASSEIASRKIPETTSRPAEQLQVTPPPAPAELASPPVMKVRPRSMSATSSSAQKVEPAGAEVLAMNAAPPVPANGEGMTAKASAEPAGIAIGGAVAGTAPAVPRGNSFAPSTGEGVQQYRATDSLSLSVNRGLAGVAQIPHPGWRVTPQGQLEHFTADGWSRVLAEEASVFRGVSVIGSDVWAGGNDGALFHSGDGGVNWHKVSIGNASGAERAAIVSIRFDDSQHGVVITDTGTSYSTTDGGVTWTKQ